MNAISFRPEMENINFINNKLKWLSKSKFINEAIKNYRIYLLRKEMREWFSLQDNSDLELCDSDFNDYISLIEKNEL